MTPVETAPSTMTESPAATTPQTSEFGSFLGVEADSLPSLQPRESSAPGGAESEPTSDEAGAQTESTETTDDSSLEPELEATTETTEEEIADDWLPTEQEKEFPLEVLERYAPRYGYTAEEIAADPRLQQVLRDKLNSDIYINQLREQTDNPDLEETTTEGTEQTVDPAAATTADPRADYYKRVDAITQKFDPKVTEELGNKLLAAFGVNTDVKKLEQMLADPKLDANTRAEVQGAIALARNSGNIGSTLARGAVDLILTSLPEVLPQVLEAVAPGMLSSYQQYQDRNIAASVWSEVSQSTDGRGKPLYPKLPAYGTPEFREMTHKAEKELGLPQGEFGKMARKGFGRQAYVMIAKHASGQRVTTQDVTRAVNTGRQQERVQQQRRATGRALGAGQVSRQFGQEETTDPVRDALRAQIQAQNSDADPFIRRGARSSSSRHGVTGSRLRRRRRSGRAKAADRRDPDAQLPPPCPASMGRHQPHDARQRESLPAIYGADDPAVGRPLVAELLPVFIAQIPKALRLISTSCSMRRKTPPTRRKTHRVRRRRPPEKRMPLRPAPALPSCRYRRRRVHPPIQAYSPLRARHPKRHKLPPRAISVFRFPRTNFTFAGAP